MIEVKDIVEVLKEVKDPEANIDVIALGLIYTISISESIDITMSLTSPFCPYADYLIGDIKDRLKEKFNKDVKVELTFTPTWTPWFMDDETRFGLDIDLSEVPNE